MNKEEIENKIKGICQDCMWLEKIEPIINQLQQENQQLKDRINKAAEYIYDEDILKILKEDNKEGNNG